MSLDQFIRPSSLQAISLCPGRPAMEAAALAVFKVGGEMLVAVNRAAVKRVLDAGGVLPWAHVKLVEQVAMKAVRP